VRLPARRVDGSAIVAPSELWSMVTSDPDKPGQFRASFRAAAGIQLPGETHRPSRPGQRGGQHSAHLYSSLRPLVLNPATALGWLSVTSSPISPGGMERADDLDVGDACVPG